LRIKKIGFRSTGIGVCVALIWISLAQGQQAGSSASRSPATIIENVRIFNGSSDRLSAPSNVLLTGNVIQTISASPIPDPPGNSLTRIQGGGRTLMPGLIDAHTHLMFSEIPQLAALTADIGYINIAAAKGATGMLMRGFTTVRDLGGRSSD
jgi:imidazolonepropionase-like amidohydrolase